MELIGNTFVVVSNFKFVSNEPAAALIRDQATKKAQMFIKDAEIQQAAIEVAETAYQAAKDGYSVWTNSFLFKLIWNDSIEAVFYNDLWMDKGNMSDARKTAFDNSTMFKMEWELPHTIPDSTWPQMQQ